MTPMMTPLSEIGIPDAALPFVLDALANSNTPHIYAAGAIAAGSLGSRAPDCVPFLLRALQPGFADHPLTFEFYAAKIPKSGVYTSPRIEAIRGLGKIGGRAKAAIPLLTELAQREEVPQIFPEMPLSSEEARTALALIRRQ